MLCAPWIATDSPHLCCDPGDFADGLLEVKILEASHLLYLASGQQFPGVCEAYVRPCLGCQGAQFLAYASGGSRPLPTSRLTPWSCSCNGTVGACVAAGVALAGDPVREVTEVKVDGTVLNAGDYRLVRDPALGAVLLRVGASWPAHQDMTLEDTEEGTWSVAYTFGNGPDPAGMAAVGALACELAAACTEGMECRLPSRLQTLSREGVTMTVLDDVTDGKFGLDEVDRWVAGVNPARIGRAGRVFSPGTLS